MALHAKGCRNGFSKRSLAGTQIADEGDHHARLRFFRQFAAEGPGFFFVFDCNDFLFHNLTSIAQKISQMNTNVDFLIHVRLIDLPSEWVNNAICLYFEYGFASEAQRPFGSIYSQCTESRLFHFKNRKQPLHYQDFSVAPLSAAASFCKLAKTIYNYRNEVDMTAAAIQARLA